MVQFYDSIPSHLEEWVRTPFPKAMPSTKPKSKLQALAQQVFFTASAPLTGTHINISPKGLPSSTFSIFTPNSAAYIDATGSGCETISHLYENGRATVMFCSFGTSPRILRFFCKGRVVEWDEPGFEPLLQSMGKRRVEGARAVICLDIFKVQTSCGFGVPFLVTAPKVSSKGSELIEKMEPVLKDRDTMGHWAHNMIEKNALLEYQAQNNSSSLDGCLGMRSAMRERGERVWVTLLKARVCRMYAQKEVLLVGFAVGVAWVLFLQLVWCRFVRP